MTFRPRDKAALVGVAVVALAVVFYLLILARAVPESSNIPALLRIIERNAKAVKVKVQTISLTGSTSSATAAPTTTPTTASASGSTTPGASAANAVPISLTLQGDYTAVDRLISRLDHLVIVSHGRVRATGPLMSISSVQLSGTSRLTAQLSVSIYQLAAPAGTLTSSSSSPTPTTGSTS